MVGAPSWAPVPTCRRGRARRGRRDPRRGRDRRGRDEGEIVEVLERNTTELVGRVYFENRVPLLEPLHRRIDHEILIELNFH